jgi:hypothetical protein
MAENMTSHLNVRIAAGDGNPDQSSQSNFDDEQKFVKEFENQVYTITFSFLLCKYSSELYFLHVP